MTDEERLKLIGRHGVLDENAQDGYVIPSDGWSVNARKEIKKARDLDVLPTDKSGGFYTVSRSDARDGSSLRTRLTPSRVQVDVPTRSMLSAAFRSRSSLCAGDP